MSAELAEGLDIVVAARIGARERVILIESPLLHL